MTPNRERLDHALHNENVCDYLDLKGNAYDWVITTAFYTSLHFVTYKIFPFEVTAIQGKKVKIENIDDYYRYTGNWKKITKHELMADLVSTHCLDISPDYDWLLSMSMNARYVNYQHDKLIANRARSLMKKIKKFCMA